MRAIFILVLLASVIFTTDMTFSKSLIFEPGFYYAGPLSGCDMWKAEDTESDCWPDELRQRLKNEMFLLTAVNYCMYGDDSCWNYAAKNPTFFDFQSGEIKLRPYLNTANSVCGMPGYYFTAVDTWSPAIKFRFIKAPDLVLSNWDSYDDVPLNQCQITFAVIDPSGLTGNEISDQVSIRVRNYQTNGPCSYSSEKANPEDEKLFPSRRDLRRDTGLGFDAPVRHLPGLGVHEDLPSRVVSFVFDPTAYEGCRLGFYANVTNGDIGLDVSFTKVGTWETTDPKVWGPPCGGANVNGSTYTLAATPVEIANNPDIHPHAIAPNPLASFELSTG
ncbi:hypothetical protein ACCS96_33115, partial [Rhizobium ruizarguesonis]